ncbi:MAG: APC family permease [Polyangiaceae bacterium]|nr:APC family permease [Polyangiaceae bacterium]
MAGGSASTSALGFWSLLSLGINGIVGVGIFFAPREVAGLVPGSLGLGVYLATALCLAPVAGVYALLGSRFAEDGGPYVWARAAFGDSASYFVGWVTAVSALFSTAAVIGGLALHVAPLLSLSGEAGRAAVALGSVVLLGGVAAVGLRPSAWAWTVLTLAKLAPLVALVLASAASESRSLPETGGVTGSAFGRAMLVCIFATQGFEIVAVPAGHVRSGRWAVGAATVGALLVAAALYTLLHAACLVLPDLASREAPLVAAAGVHGGARLARGVEIATTVSALGIAFGMMAMTPRYVAALGRTEALGRWLSRESRQAVPLRALGMVVLLVALLGAGPGLQALFVLSAVAVVAQYSVSALSLLVLSTRRRHQLGPRHVAVALAALVPVALVGAATRWTELLFVLVTLLVGAGVLALRRAAGAGRSPD